MRDFLIKLLGGKTKKEHHKMIETVKLQQELQRISRSDLDYASTVLKRWNEYRDNINHLVSEIHKHNANYFYDNEQSQSLFFELVLQDYYFRRLFLLRYDQDFYNDVSDKGDCWLSYKSHFLLKKAFWEIEPKFLEIIYSDKYIKDWNKC